jgi:O-antigen/teichoic acid export membrane protein
MSMASAFGRPVNRLINWVNDHPGKAGAIAGWYQQVASGIITLAIIPLIIYRLSKEGAGIWFSFQNLSALVILTDFGIGFVISRQTAFSKTAGAATAAQPPGDFIATTPGLVGIVELHAATRVIFNRILIVAVALLIIIYELILPHGQLLQGQASALRPAWYLLGISAVLLLRSTQYLAFLDGLGKMFVSRFLGGTYQFVCGVAVIVAVLLVRDITVLAVATVTVTAFYLLIARQLFLRNVRGEVPHRAPARPELIRSVWRIAVPMGIVGIGNYFVTLAQVPLLGSLLGPALVAPFYIAQKIGQTLNVAVTQATQPQMPLFTHALAAGDVAAARHRMERIIKFTFAMSLLLNVAFFLFSPLFVRIWMGSGHYVDQSTLALLAVNYFVAVVTVVTGSFVLSSGINPFVWSALAMGALTLLGCFLFAPRFGVAGIAAAGLFAGMLSNYWYFSYRALRLRAELGQQIGD